MKSVDMCKAQQCGSPCRNYERQNKSLKGLPLQVYAPINEAEYREYREWFLSINTASGGDR